MKNIKIKFNNLTLYFLLITLLCGYIKSALIILFIILFHELGHVLISLILGYKILSVEIYPFGGMTKIDKLLNSKIYKDLLIAVFGIIFQFIIHILCILNVILDPLVYRYNLSIMLFNLLPIIPLDGSKIIFELLNYKFAYKKSLTIYTILSLFFIIIYFVFNYHYELNNYMIIALFVTKTIECIKNRNVIHHKFIIERFLYAPEFSKVENNNQKVINYHKQTKYYYNINNKIISEKEYLKKLFDKI
ncbi:MAG: hypothetical protein E7167_00270 [Firmicutes bacterium]|nr:hypothetical protein [Bacillota bacterium]